MEVNLALKIVHSRKKQVADLLGERSNEYQNVSSWLLIFLRLIPQYNFKPVLLHKVSTKASANV